MSRNPELNQKLKDERREQILSVSLRLFAAKGLAGTKITDISGAAGISQGLVYHYFSSKDDIFIALIQQAFDKMNAACLALEALDLPPREKIGAAMTQLLADLERSPDFAGTCLLIAMAGAAEGVPGAARAKMESSYRTPYRVIAGILRAGQADGSIKGHDPEQMALAFWTTFNGLAIYKAVHPETYRSPDPAILLSMFF